MYMILSSVSIVIIRILMAVAGKDRQQRVMLRFRQQFDHVSVTRTICSVRTATAMYRILRILSIVIITIVMAVAGEDRQQSVVLAFSHRFDHVSATRTICTLVHRLREFIGFLVVLVLL